MSEFTDGNKRVLLQSATGSGKTRMAIEIIRRLPKPCLVLAHTLEIVNQTYDAINAIGERAEMLTADTRTDGGYNELLDTEYDAGYSITVASQPTAWSRGVRAGHRLRQYKSIVADECHRATARTWRELFALYPDALVLGLSATPARSDGNGLGGDLFQTIVRGESYDELIKAGYLVDAPMDKIWSWQVDWRGVATNKNDYIMGGKKGAAKIAHTDKRVGDCVAHWLKLAKGRPTIIFASSVAHAHHLRDRFVAEGVKAEAIDGDTDKQVRADVLAALGKLEIDMVINYGVLTEGADIPAVSCICVGATDKKLFAILTNARSRLTN